MQRVESTGRCELCGHQATKSTMTRHLRTCTAAHDKRGVPRELLALRIEAADDPGYWLHLEARSRATLEALDVVLRKLFQARVRFAGGVARKSWFDAGLWLTRRATHPRLRRVETYGPKTYVRRFRLERPEDIDAKLAALVRESYSVGCQEHLDR